MPDAPTRWFSFAIAYVCPGFAVVAAVAPHSRAVQRWLGLVAQQQASIGSLVFVVLVATTLGVLLSGVRLLVFEKLLFKRFPVLPPAPKDDHKRQDSAYDQAYRDIRDSFFPFYQFFSHMAVAAVPVAISLVAHFGLRREVVISVVLAFIAAEAVLYTNARHSLHRFRQRREDQLSKPIDIARAG